MLKFVVLIATFMQLCSGHGRMMEPPSRASQWRMGFDNPKDYNDNQGFCGGKDHQHQEMGGLCGICGDPYDGPWDHQAPGGIYANGNIVAEYTQGSWIDVILDITTNHLGYFMFRICPNNDITQDPEQDCFDKYVLETNSGSEKYHVTDWRKGYWNTSVELPSGMMCDQCILQWTYTAGNDWGTCDNGTSSLGCGPQETFRACADIKIKPELKSDLENDHSNSFDNDLSNDLDNSLIHDLGNDLVYDLNEIEQNPYEPRLKKLSKLP